MPPAFFRFNYTLNETRRPSRASLQTFWWMLWLWEDNALNDSSWEISRCFLFPVLNMKGFLKVYCVSTICRVYLWCHMNIYLIFKTPCHENSGTHFPHCKIRAATLFKSFRISFCVVAFCLPVGTASQVSLPRPGNYGKASLNGLPEVEHSPGPGWLTLDHVT